ncbi:MAG: hypothetical protein ACK4PR_09595 [Gammaproteobacteria bacterium]
MSLMDNVKQLDSKQKVMLVATIGCLGLVFYLAYTTFFPDNGSSPAPVPQQQVSQPPVTMTKASSPSPVVQPIASPTTDDNNALSTNDNNPAQESNDQTIQVGHEAPPSPQNLAMLAQSQQMQQQYIQLVNEYQLAQLQQKLAQVDAQIIASKLTTTKSLVQLKQLQPLLGSDNGTSMTGTTSTAPSNNTSQGFQTMYVGQTSGKWLALLESGGQYFQVTVGMRLPDGSVVNQINSRGVVIVNNTGTSIFLPMGKSLD